MRGRSASSLLMPHAPCLMPFHVVNLLTNLSEARHFSLPSNTRPMLKAIKRIQDKERSKATETCKGADLRSFRSLRFWKGAITRFVVSLHYAGAKSRHPATSHAAAHDQQ